MATVMADLEELGSIQKPHTSAGRVPTDIGYRFYIDCLVKLHEPEPQDRELIEHGIKRQGSNDETFQDASKMLHFITRHAGGVLMPRHSALYFLRIEVGQLRWDRLLAVLVCAKRRVKNKLC